jgi:hypothetical protein
MIRKNIIRSLLLVILLGISCTGCGSRRIDDVVVIEKTRTYHTDACPRVNMALTRVMSREEARSLNCKPCPGCQPDKGMAGSFE